MSSSSIKLSPKGAFSLYWNQCLDHNTSCFIRVGKSIAGFLEALFCGRTVSKSEAGIDTVLQGIDHRKSVFSKECIRKFKTLKIDIVKELGSEKQETNDEKQEGKKNDPTAVSTNPDRQEHLRNENKEPKEDPATRLDVDKVSVDTLIILLNSDNVSESDDRFSEQSLKLLKPEECLLLFGVALGEGYRDIALRCLLIGNCNGLMNLEIRHRNNSVLMAIHCFIACDFLELYPRA